MYHKWIPDFCQQGNVLLLSGSDNKVHVYESDDESSTFIEVPVGTYFPELSQRFPDIVTRLRIEPVNEITRYAQIHVSELSTVLSKLGQIIKYSLYQQAHYFMWTTEWNSPDLDCYLQTAI